jgi:hypothetical protein
MTKQHISPIGSPPRSVVRRAGRAALVLAAALSVWALPRPVQAASIDCGVPVSKQLDAGETDEFEFLAAAGDVVSIDALDVSGTIGFLHMQLIGPPSGGEEPEDDVVLVDTCSGRIDRAILTSGTYRLEVSDCVENEGEDEAGEYTVTLSGVNPDRHGEINCGTPLSCGLPTREAGLAVIGEVDTYTFPALAGESVTLSITAPNAGLGLLEMRMYDSTGALVADSCGGNIVLRPARSGTYTVLVNACVSPGTGRYTLVWTPSTCPVSCTGDCDNSGDVTVDELIMGVNIDLGLVALEDCPSFDRDNSGDVTIDELIAAVGYALTTCPAAPSQ